MYRAVLVVVSVAHIHDDNMGKLTNLIGLLVQLEIEILESWRCDTFYQRD